MNPTHSQRRQYNEAMAAGYRAEAEHCLAMARANERYVVAHLCDPYEDSEENRTRRSLANAAMVLDYKRYAEHYTELAKSYDARAEEAKSDEIRQDYYSGPSGSFTGD